MSQSLTRRQQQVLDLIRDEIRRSGFPPTRAEIAQALGFRSANAAEDHLRALARKGAIALTPGASRGIRLLNDAATGTEPGSGFMLPIVGRVAAGHPILASENIEAEVGVQASLFARRPDYLLRVRGASMRDAGILDGDLLAVHKTPDALHGQIIVARLGDEVTVKRLFRQSGQLRLLPENPDFSPMDVGPQDDFVIEGLAVGLIRNQAL
ncbi:MAG: transcriptional repressor LexA [Castellaniella sp.]